jgi:hypothetical protein
VDSGKVQLLVALGLAQVFLEYSKLEADSWEKRFEDLDLFGYNGKMRHVMEILQGLHIHLLKVICSTKGDKPSQNSHFLS